jgi:hypothetical protein
MHLGGAADGVNDAREFQQHPVAGRLDDAAGMLADLRVDELAAMRLEALVRAFLVHAHQARIARHIGGQDRGETADSGHFSPGAIKFSGGVYPEIVLYTWTASPLHGPSVWRQIAPTRTQPMAYPA